MRQALGDLEVVDELALRGEQRLGALRIQHDEAVVAIAGDIANASLSLDAIDASSFKNKALDTVSKIFVGKAMINEAYTLAMKIDNAYLKTKSIQRILNKGNAEEQDVEPSEDLAKVE